MNEASKLMSATALVALGLGLAYLCGPPADSPQVVHGFAEGCTKPQLRPPGGFAAAAPLRLHADARAADAAARVVRPERLVEVAPEGVILSAAEADLGVNKLQTGQPRWHAPSAGGDNRDLLPPRPVEFDSDAAPLSPAVPHSSARIATQDDWLLSPPVIPRDYNAQSATGIATTAHTSELRTNHLEQPEDSAWWTRDTPRLQGLNAATAPNFSSPPNLADNSSQAPIDQKRANNSLTAPIDLDRLVEAPSATPPPVPSHVRHPPTATSPVPPTTRIHLIADGDTLARLAERYLGDSGQANQILELNRDVLRSADLLPIGAPLRIPAAAQQIDPELGAASSPGRLVPVAAVPLGSELQPHAQLQPPAPLAASDW